LFDLPILVGSTASGLIGQYRGNYYLLYMDSVNNTDQFLPLCTSLQSYSVI